MSLHTDLLTLRDLLAAIQRNHAAEIARTVHTICPNGHTVRFQLDRALGSVEDNLLDALDTYDGYHGIGEYAPTPEQLRDMAQEDAADARAER
jgi:hypothetical protein